jgi:hypothetical protein
VQKQNRRNAFLAALPEHHRISRESSRSQRRIGRYPAQFEHPVPDIAILCQMRGGTSFAAGGHHLIDRTALGELRIEFPAELTRPAGPGVKTIDDGGVNVFHEERLLGGENGFARL